MKFLILFLACVALVASDDFTDEQNDRWLNFKLDHNRLFLSPGTEKARKETFLSNCDEIDALNQRFENNETLYTADVNPFSDLTSEQFMSRFTGIAIPDSHTYTGPVITMRQTPPASCDLRTKHMSSIRNQNPCGSCWAFCSVAAAEYAYCKKNQIDPCNLDLSEQELVDCCYPVGEDSCQGGWITTAFQYMSDKNGLVKETSYPYTKPQVSGACNIKSSYPKYAKLDPKQPYTKINGDCNSIKNALNTLGALAICVDASKWENVKLGIFFQENSAKSTGNICNHGVVLVGYGTDVVSENGVTKNVDYWLIRNSWDTWFGDKGYVKLDARQGSYGIKGGIFLDKAYFPNVL